MVPSLVIFLIPRVLSKIEPQLNQMSRENYGARLEVYITFFKENWDSILRAELDLPEDAFFTFTKTNPENWGVLHHATFRAPFPDNRHGLTITFDIPQNEEASLIRAKPVIQKMLSSIKWVERNTVCTPAESTVIGSWLHVHEQAATKLSPHKMTITKKMNFFEEGHWGFWQWELKAPLGIKPEEVNENEFSEEEADATTTPKGKVSPIDEKQQLKAGDA